MWVRSTLRSPIRAHHHRRPIALRSVATSPFPRARSVALLYDATAARWRPLTFVGLGPDGSASRPAYSFANDPDTGVYRIGANDLGIGSERAPRCSISRRPGSELSAISIWSGRNLRDRLCFRRLFRMLRREQIALDDYEEGTWTPTLNFAGGTTGITYSTQTGIYVKVGQLVAVQCNITLSNKGSSTGGVSRHIAVLPFTCSSGTYSVALPLYRLFRSI